MNNIKCLINNKKMNATIDKGTKELYILNALNKLRLNSWRLIHGWLLKHKKPRLSYTKAKLSFHHRQKGKINLILL